ncbi:retrovirus-related pol polyprotein from transposon TNT 1-94 [Tanacetum coccineum]
MTKSLANKLYLKKQFYTFYTWVGRKISEHIYEFNKIVLHLANIERNCLKNKSKKSTGFIKKDEQPSSSGSTYDDSEVVMVMSAHSLLDWIMDSGCSYHMTHRVVLSGIRRDNCVYSLDGHAMACELNVVENRTARTVKKLRTDNGLEFCNREFEQLCIESEIARHLTVVGTPQENGLAESIEKKTPMKMWSAHPSDYGMLRIFSCVAYSHDKQELHRLNNYMPEEDQTNQEDGDDEDVGDQETDQTPDLIDYELA